MDRLITLFFWGFQIALDYGILVVYIWGLWCLARPKEKLKTGRLERTNFWTNTICLAVGIGLFGLSLYFKYTDEELLSMAADAGNALFYWILLFSKMMDIAESSREYKAEKSKGSLFHTVRHTLLLAYKIYKLKGAWVLLKWLLTLKRALVLLIGFRLSGAFAVAILVVAAGYFVGKKRLQDAQVLPPPRPISLRPLGQRPQNQTHEDV